MDGTCGDAIEDGGAASIALVIVVVCAYEMMALIELYRCDSLPYLGGTHMFISVYLIQLPEKTQLQSSLMFKT